MIELILAASAALAVDAAAPHRTTVTHRGTPYEVGYHPQVRTVTKTIGMSAGTRASTERCRWTSEIRVERRMGRSDGSDSHTRLLPAAHTIEGSVPGHCGALRQSDHDARIAARDDVRDHVRTVAAQDHATLLADIDAAHELAAAD